MGQLAKSINRFPLEPNPALLQGDAARLQSMDVQEQADCIRHFSQDFGTLGQSVSYDSETVAEVCSRNLPA